MAASTPFHARALFTATALASPWLFAPAFAQESTASEETTAQPIEEVVVTARRREESLRDVPLSVTAFSGQQLQDLGAEDLTYLSQTTPNVTLEVSRGTNTTLTAFIRGVGQQDPVAGFEQGVGIYVDDVYLNRPQAAVLDLYEVERVEVLRGPQGTLYGRNTIGGAIKYVTKRLSDEPTVNLRVSGGTYRQLDAVGSFSTPVVENFKIGGAIGRFSRNGFGENINIEGLDNYNKDILAGRLSAEFTPTDRMFFRIAGDYLVDDSDPRQGHRLITSLVSGEPVLNSVFDTRAGLNTPEQRVEARGIAGNAEIQVTDELTFKAILAYRDDESSSPIDFDSLPAQDVDAPVIYENDQWSAEFQALYTNRFVAGIVGFYYLDAFASNTFDVILAETGALVGLPGLNAFTFGEVDTRTWAIFGDASVDLLEVFGMEGGRFLEKLELSFGGRYTSDERSSRIIRSTFLGGFSPTFGGEDRAPIAVTSDFDGSETFSDFNPRASISYGPIPQVNLYFTYSQGFKGGSFDPRGQTTATPDFDGDGQVSEDEIFDFLLFEPETVDSYEFGLKFDAFGGRFRGSAAYFIADYSDVQIPGSVGVDTDGDGFSDTFAGITSNAASADLSGIEFESNAILGQSVLCDGDSFSLATTMGHINAQFNEFIDAFGTDVANQRTFQNTPKFTASGTFRYDAPQRMFGMEGVLSMLHTLSYRSRASQFEARNPFLDQGAFTLYDASLIWAPDNGHWTIGVYARNIFNEEYIVAGYNFVNQNDDGSFTPTLGTEGVLTGFYGNPRTVTGTVTVSF